MLNKVIAILRFYFVINAIIVLGYLLIKKIPNDFTLNHTLAFVFVFLLVLNYLLYEILKGVSELKNTNRPFIIMYLITIPLVWLFAKNIFFDNPPIYFKQNIHGFWGSTTLLIALILTAYDFFILNLRWIKKINTNKS